MLQNDACGCEMSRTPSKSFVELYDRLIYAIYGHDKHEERSLLAIDQSCPQQATFTKAIEVYILQILLPTLLPTLPNPSIVLFLGIKQTP